MVFSWFKKVLGKDEESDRVEVESQEVKEVTQDLLIKELKKQKDKVLKLEQELESERALRIEKEDLLKVERERYKKEELKREIKEEILEELGEDYTIRYGNHNVSMNHLLSVGSGLVVNRGQEVNLGGVPQIEPSRLVNEHLESNKKESSLEDSVRRRGRKKRTTEGIAREIEELTEGEYEHSLTPVKIRRKKCGLVRETQIGNFRTSMVNGNTSVCEQEESIETKLKVEEVSEEHTQSRLRSRDSVAEEITELTGGEYELVGEYTGAQNKITVRHIECEREYGVRINNFRRDIRNGRECVCEEEVKEVNFKKAVREGGILEDDLIVDGGEKVTKVKDRLYKAVGNEYRLVSGYDNQYSNVTLKHNVCGRNIVVQMSNFLYKGYRCKDCTGTITKGEKKIKDYLDTYYPDSYIHQRRELIKDREHFYDFLIKGLEEEHLGYIEYNGEQHYRAIDYFGGSEKYKEQIGRDRDKRKYAESKGISVLEIPYTMKDKEWSQVIDKYMLELGFNKVWVNYKKELGSKGFRLLGEEEGNLTIKCQGCKGEQVVKKYEVHDYLKCTYCGSRVR